LGFMATCISTGSPGARWTTVKVMRVMPNRSGIIISMRFRR